MGAMTGIGCARIIATVRHADRSMRESGTAGPFPPSLIACSAAASQHCGAPDGEPDRI